MSEKACNSTESVFSGPFPSFKAAENAVRAQGFAKSTDAVADAARAVLEGRGTFDRDGVVFSHDEINWPILGCLLHAMGVSQRPRKTIVDFGGGLGSFYRQHRRFLEGLDLRWCVVETPELVAAGAEFTDETLRFFPSIAAASAKFGEIDAALFSGVISYLPSVGELFDEVSGRIPSIIISRNWEGDGMDDTYYVQRVSEGDDEYEVVFRLCGRNGIHSDLLDHSYRLMVSEDEDEPIGIHGRIYYSKMAYWRQPAWREEGRLAGGWIAPA